MGSRAASTDDERRNPSAAAERGRLRAKREGAPLADLEDSNVDDVKLAASLARGQHDAMVILVAKYEDHVFRIARRWLVDCGEAKDMVQQVFLEAFQDIASFDADRGRFRTWLLTIAHNRSINRRRHLEKHGFYNPPSAQEDVLDQSTDRRLNRLGLSRPEMSCLTSELFTLLEPRERRVIELIYTLGLTREQVAVELGLTVSAVKHSLTKGLAILYSAVTESGKGRTASRDGKGKDASVD
jgi:RNA polymerase sigma-70 factor (ECF subfamily)